MKRILLTLLMLASLTCMSGLAVADEAADITMDCIVNGNAYNHLAPDDMRDRALNSFYTGSAVTIEAPEGTLIGSVEIKWRTISMPGVVVKVLRDGKWVEVMRDGPRYATQYLVLPEPAAAVRITPQTGKLELCEITVLTEGDAPAYVQIWRDPPEKVDLMLFSTHPDDEVLWFGGLLPYYAGEMKKDVLVINAVYGHFYRRQELLAALWTCGVDIYPVMLGYPNQQDTVPEVLREWRVKNRDPENRTVSLIRQYKPDVVVLHDERGEYGHTAHIAFNWLGEQAVQRAGDPQEHPQSAAEWGVWDVPKTYVHLYGENQLRMDWSVPLEAFGGKTGYEVAAEGFACHVSQHERWHMTEGGEYDNALFGLWRTLVGPDVQGNDLFENIPAQ